jgi:hypothetical protein
MAERLGQVLAVIHDYDELVEALRKRVDVLQIPHCVIDDLAGLPDRYAAKLLCPHQLKSIGRISFNVLGALGVSLVMVEDQQALAKMRRHHAWRERKYRRPAA